MNWEKIKPVLAYAYMVLIILIAIAIQMLNSPPE